MYARGLYKAMSQRSILFVGHSHTDCIAAAAKQIGAENVAVVSLTRHEFTEGLRLRREKQKAREQLKRDKNSLARSRRQLEKEAVQRTAMWISGVSPMAEPDVICLCLEGNRHNVLGLVENPSPFSIGHEEAGCVPPMGGERHFIPYRVLWDIYDTPRLRALTPNIFSLFPTAKRICLSPPPPVGDWKRIRLGPWMNALKDRDPTPKELKLHLYRVQCEVLRDMAEKVGASFIEPDESLLDDGFLSIDYCADVTHGNVAYGEVMLKRVMDKAAGLR